jgi:membrane carboxypeptidase/penicillin-binding protein
MTSSQSLRPVTIARTASAAFSVNLQLGATTAMRIAQAYEVIANVRNGR